MNFNIDLINSIALSILIIILTGYLILNKNNIWKIQYHVSNFSFDNNVLKINNFNGLNEFKNLNKSITDINIIEINAIIHYIPLYFFDWINVTDLLLMATNINIIPSQIGLLKNLKSLRIIRGNIEVIPNEIKSLLKLETLNLSYNKIKIIPNEIFELINLKALILQNNKIQKIPSNIIKLNRLITLNLRNNNIRTIKNLILPKFLINFIFENNPIDNYIMPTHINRSRNFIFENNRIHNYLRPRHINRSINYLTNNKMNNIPYIPLYFFDWTNVTDILLIGTNINIIPSQIGLLKNLKSLRIIGGNIEVIPNEIKSLLLKLETLNLSNNKIKIIPNEIFELINLKAIIQSKKIQKNLSNIMELNRLITLNLRNNPIYNYLRPTHINRSINYLTNNNSSPEDDGVA